MLYVICLQYNNEEIPVNTISVVTKCFGRALCHPLVCITKEDGKANLVDLSMKLFNGLVLRGICKRIMF